ncbi:glycosyltransferase [Patescibacteria group bacterium]|nr:glycosyltransferase [Patescibacteria group bacterium]
MRVAIVHDDLVQWGGAERVLLGLSEIYPDAPIYTSVFDNNNFLLSKVFGSKKIITSFLQKIPGWRSLYKALLPLYPIAFEQFDFSMFDLVISHTTRFAKSIITKPETKHICYCHTPPRFLWHFSGEKNYGFAESLLSKLRIYDSISARRVDLFLAGSENAKKRIKKVYGMDAKVVYPFVDLERFKGIESFDGGYFVVMGRPNKYKRFDLAKAACRKLGFPLKIIDGRLDEGMVLQVLAGCKALIVPGIEDFGLAGLEAQALGKPVIAYAEGGSLETVIPNKTGIFFPQQNVVSLTDAIIKLDKVKIDPGDCSENASRFSKEDFIKNFKEVVNDL